MILESCVLSLIIPQILLPKIDLRYQSQTKDDASTDLKFHEEIMENTYSSTEEKKRKIIVLLRSSITKNIQRKKLLGKVKQNNIVRSFPEAKLERMTHYVKPMVALIVSLFFLVATKNLRTYESLQEIANKTIKRKV